MRKILPKVIQRPCSITRVASNVDCENDEVGWHKLQLVFVFITLHEQAKDVNLGNDQVVVHCFGTPGVEEQGFIIPVGFSATVKRKLGKDVNVEEFLCSIDNIDDQITYKITRFPGNSAKEKHYSAGTANEAIKKLEVDFQGIRRQNNYSTQGNKFFGVALKRVQQELLSYSKL